MFAELMGEDGNIRSGKMSPSAAKSDLSNVESLPSAVLLQLKGDTGAAGATGATGQTGAAGATNSSATSLNGYTLSVVTAVPSSPVANTIYLVEV